MGPGGGERCVVLRASPRFGDVTHAWLAVCGGFARISMIFLQFRSLGVAALVGCLPSGLLKVPSGLCSATICGVDVGFFSSIFLCFVIKKARLRIFVS